MAQQYDPNLPASGQTTFGELYGILRNKFEALRTSFSGTSFPLNPVAGQVCFRKDRKKWYIYVNDTSIGENGWVEIAIASAGLGAEIINARGSKSSLDERLDVSLNEDGTLKANVAAYQSEWIKPSLTFTYVDSTSFKVEGNQTDIYAPYRRLKINHSTSATGYTHVVSATYDDTNDETTVTVADAVIQSDLVSIEHGIIHSDRNKDSLPRNINADTVDNFHASQTPTANTIPVADSNGYINDWINQGEGSGLDADLLRGLSPSQFLRSDTKELELTLDNNTGNSGKFVIKTLGVVVDAKTGLILFAKKYTDTYLPKQGFEGFVFVNRGNDGAINISQMFKVVCVSAYNSTKCWLEGNSTGAYLVETEYNGEPWYGLYLKAPISARTVTIIGQLWGDPIFIDDASEYSITRVTSNEGYSLSQNGYQLLPNGLIIQWGQVSNDGSGQVNFTFPIQFPNGVFSITYSSNTSSSPQHTTYINNVSTSGATMEWRQSDGVLNTDTGITARWIAIGY